MRKREKERYRQTERVQTECRQREIRERLERERQTDRQTDRQTEIEREREREREIESERVANLHVFPDYLASIYTWLTRNGRSRTPRSTCRTGCGRRCPRGS